MNFSSWLMGVACMASVAMAAPADELDYERIFSLGKRTEGKVFGDRVEAVFNTGQESVEFRVNGDHGPEYHILNLKTGERRKVGREEVPALMKRPAKLSRARRSRNGGAATELVIANQSDSEAQLYWIDTQGERQSYGTLAAGSERIVSTYAGHLWLVLDNTGKRVGSYMAEAGGTRAVFTDDADGDSREKDTLKKESSPSAATRLRCELYLKESNVWGRDSDAGDDFALTTDGSAEDAYVGPISWSSDGRHAALFRVKPAKEKPMNFVEPQRFPDAHTTVKTIPYAKPGDEIESSAVALFDLQERKQVPVVNALFPTPWSLDRLHWRGDGTAFSLLYNQRGHQVLRLLSVDALTGRARVLAEEVPKTFVDYTNKVWQHFLPGDNELLWMSERDGWNHLYLIDTAAGRVKHQITKGEWVVRKVERVDAEKRQVWFSAGGIRAGQDPYQTHLCRINLDGSGLVILTEGDGSHKWEFSDDRRYFIDRWSRPDMPAVTEIRSAEDGRLIAELARGTMQPLLETGWQAPERFVAKGRDGKTDIYGVIWRPTSFDAHKKYPVIEKVYAGPQSQFAPKEFELATHTRELGEAGFILVQADGMGTNWRSKAFHDVCWKNLQDAGFADRIAWIKAAAVAHPEMDLKRVGIFGGSAGGQTAMRALIDHSDFYSAAVADCGCHDNRMDKIWWNEQWMGWPVGREYLDASNAVQAPRLQGHLFLTWGEMDTNVDPASSMQVAAALVKAGKDFDMFVLPGSNHGAGESPILHRKRMAFFSRWLGGPL